ncbi:MAG: RDD family protein [Bacteroidota bacterium]
MKTLTLRRIGAYLLDYTIIAVYASLLFGMTILLDLKNSNLTPLSGQLVGLVLMTLPVFLYFFLMEQSKNGATIGKKILNIAVSSEIQNRRKSVLKRNVIKFLPWELAHTGVHWMVFYSASESEPPVWVWITLVIPQIIVIAYLISIILSKGKSSLYDWISKTSVILIDNNNLPNRQ